MSKICIPIFVRSAGPDLEEAIAQAEDILSPLGAPASAPALGMIELRADTASPHQLLTALDLAHVPVIVTMRPLWEGGYSTKTDDQRIALWEAAMEAGAEFIDVELAAWEKSRVIRETLTELLDKHGARLIVSNHSFDRRPGDLLERVKRLRNIKQASILKIAWKATSILDAVEALRLIAENSRVDGRPMVALAMGEEGMVSRVLAGKFSAPFTFASAEAGKESAAGQPTALELLERYRWKHQQADTPVFGVAGWPVGHSLSPHIHNAGFDALDVPGVYVPLAIQGNYQAFHDAVEALRATVDLRGLSVTIPHKENAFRYVTEKGGQVDELGRKIGAINTISFPTKDGGNLRGLNTDYAGALDALVTAWTGNRDDVKGRRIAVIGAGGAARAIVAGLAAHGATVTIYNRTLEKAQVLAREFSTPDAQVLAASIDQLPASACEAYINCTPLGMHPMINASPLDNLSEPDWTKNTVVFDTVYNPRLTQFLRFAQKKGAKIITGDEMFLRQAAIQFREFTGREAPLEVFRRVLGEALTG